MMAGSESISLEDAALYTVEERLETFKIKHCGWPFDSGPCTPLKVRITSSLVYIRQGYIPQLIMILDTQHLAPP